MPPITVQVFSLVLPQVAWDTGAETEVIADIVEHTSREITVEYLQEKEIHIQAEEISEVPAAIVGDLWCWIELSPYLSTWTPTYWAAIGGGGGAIVPTAPYIEASGLGGAAGALVHTFLLPWAIHSPYARVVVQTPVIVPNTYWLVRALFSGKK